MDLASLKTIKNLIGAHGVRPSRGLGQNFLLDRGAVRKVIETAELRTKDKILEIGPGLGVLTRELARTAEKVVAVEKDVKMVEILAETLEEYKNIEIIHGDIRKIEDWKLKIGNSYKVVGNLPFYLTAPVIRQLLELREAQPRTMTLIIQKEVAQRICAKVPDMNLLAVSVQFYASPKIISYISKDSFWPSPEVNAAIIKITPLVKPDFIEKKDLFFKIVKAGFSQPRKQLVNNLSKNLKADKKNVGEWLLKNNISPAKRAEALTIENWKGLTFSINMLK